MRLEDEKFQESMILSKNPYPIGRKLCNPSIIEVLGELPI
jgi:hypothetical protein